MNELTATTLVLDVKSIAEILGVLFTAVMLGGIGFKVLWTFIEVKYKLGNKDFLTADEIDRRREKYCHDNFIAKTDFQTFLQTFCSQHQASCPKVTDMTLFSDNMRTLAETMKEVVTEQKKLRQEILPEKYVRKEDFNATVERIEKSVEEACTTFQTTAGGIFKRINEVHDQINDRIDNVKGATKVGK